MKYFIFIFFIALSLLAGLPARAEGDLLAVPFTPQAPDGRWIEPWQNACEETTVAMVNAYYTNKQLTDSKARKGIQAVLKQKEKMFGKSKDESPQKIVELINKTYRWRAKRAYGMTIADIQREIDARHPVIFPFDARKVTNPNFSDPKPEYHMVVIIGYDDVAKEFIVQEPGTSKGEKFHYSYDELVVANAMYTVRDSKERLGGEVIFTAPEEGEKSHSVGFLRTFFLRLKALLARN